MEKANVLNDYFRSQNCLNDLGKNVPELLIPDKVIDSIVLTTLEVVDILKNVPIGKASGPDGISNTMLREASIELSGPLCTLFNKSLSCKIVPDCWKEAHVTAVFKSGDNTKPNNYRPISLLNRSVKLG